MATIMTVKFEPNIIPFTSPTVHTINARPDFTDTSLGVAISDDGTWVAIRSTDLSNDINYELWEKVAGVYTFRDITTTDNATNLVQFSPDGGNLVYTTSGNNESNSVPRSGSAWGVPSALSGGTSDRERITSRKANHFALDGDRLVLDTGNTNTGLWGFWTRSGSTYTFGSEIFGASDNNAVCVSHNGDVVAVSDDSNNDLRMYEWNGSTYVFAQTVLNVAPAGDLTHIAMNNDGSVVVVQAGFAPANVIVRSGTWAQTQELTGFNGTPVMSRNGLLAFSDPFADVYGGNARGEVTVHVPSGTTYSTTPTANLRIPAADVSAFPSDVFSFGINLNMSADGKHIIVGAREVDNQDGKTYVFDEI